MNERRNTWLYDDIGMWRARWLILAGILSLVTLFTVAFAIAVPISMVQCHESADRIGKVTGHYRILTGCYFRLPNGREVPTDRYPPKYIHISKGQK